jgi:hypothetical protein
MSGTGDDPILHMGRHHLRLGNEKSPPEFSPPSTSTGMVSLVAAKTALSLATSIPEPQRRIGIASHSQ